MRPSVRHVTHESTGDKKRLYPSASTWTSVRKLNQALDVAEADAKRPASARSYTCPDCSHAADGSDTYCLRCGARNPEVFEALASVETRLAE